MRRFTRPTARTHARRSHRRPRDPDSSGRGPTIAHEIELRPVLAALCAQNPDRRRINQLAGSLASSALFSKSAEFNVGHMIGTDKSLLALERLNRQAVQIITRICDLGTEPRLMVEKSLTLDQDTNTREILSALAKLAKASAAAHGDIQRQPYSRGMSAKPKKTASRTVARKAYDIFEELTGAPPTISTNSGKAEGPYLGLLNDIFRILDIRASPEAAAREIFKEKRVTRTK
jgi:hypothetical protein